MYLKIHIVADGRIYFLRLNIIPLYGQTTYCLSVYQRQLSCFLLLFMVNNTAVNMHVQMLVSYIPRSGIAMAYGNSLTF